MKQKLKSLIKRTMPQRYYSRLAVYRLQLMDIYRYCLSFLYIGHRFECPFCGGHFRKFLPGGLDSPVLKDVVGAGYRSNKKCPRCDSYDKERLILLYIRNKTNLFYEALKVLHVAPERNLQKVLSSLMSIDYVSVDLDSSVATVKMDITNIEYEDSHFDVIICSHVLEHILDDHKAMSELYRVLKPGGWAVLQVPVSQSMDKTYEDPTVVLPKERERIFGQWDHVRIYGRDYRDRLENAGFSVKVYNFASEFGEFIAHKYCIQKDEDLYICTKPN